MTLLLGGVAGDCSIRLDLLRCLGFEAMVKRVGA
jgi:hypothetical protein